MTVAGAVLLAVAVVALLVARSQAGRRQALDATERISCGDLERLAGGVRGEAGADAFAQPCELVGTARPGPAGPQRAPLSGQDSVWHRARVTHRWEDDRPDATLPGTGAGPGMSAGGTMRGEDVVSDETSEAPLVLEDETGRVVIEPAGAEIDGPEVSLDRFEPAQSGGGSTVSGFGVTVHLDGDRRRSLGFQSHEKLIRPGRRLYVLGEAREVDGVVHVGRPRAGGRLLISTRSEEELSSSARRGSQVATAVAGVAGLAGLGLLLAGLLG